MVQQNFCATFGIGSGSTAPGTSTIALLSTSTNAVAFSFVARSTTQLAAVRLRVTSFTAGGTLTCQVYGDSGGAPNLSGGVLAGGTLTVGTITTNSYVAATGGTVSVTQGTRYWVVLNNPTTNGLTILYGAGSVLEPYTGSWISTSTNFSPPTAAWSRTIGSGGMRFDFADGSYVGTVFSAISAANTNKVFGSNEFGVQFTTPSFGSLNIAGIHVPFSTNGSPTGNVNFKLYNSSHGLIAQTDSIPNAEAIAFAGWKGRSFTGGVQTLSPATTYTITMADSAPDSSSNFFMPYVYNWDLDTNSLTLIPWSAQLDNYNGSVWSQTAGTFPLFELLLASGNEFANTGGGSLLVHPGMAGGMRG